MTLNERSGDTGLDTDTGGRISGCKHLLGDTFFATYADGLSDVPLDTLVAYHRDRGGLATITSVSRPFSSNTRAKSRR